MGEVVLDARLGKDELFCRFVNVVATLGDRQRYDACIRRCQSISPRAKRSAGQSEAYTFIIFQGLLLVCYL